MKRHCGVRMDSAGSITSAQPGVKAAQLFLSTSPASVEYNHVLRLVGQDVSLALLERGAEGVKLELPTGQVITAKGDLPFPEGTQLQVRISVQNGLIKLQTLEAQPPSPASILGPLSQSEAVMLLQKLQNSDLSEALLPLAKLFASMVMPKDAQLQQAIESLPAPTQQLLSLLFGIKDGNPALLTRSLIERFEPMTSLLEMNSFFANKQVNDASSAINNNYKLTDNNDPLINGLREIFLKYFESGSMNNAAVLNPEQYRSMFESLKSELLSVLTPLLEKTTQNAADGGVKADITEKIMQALKLLPESARNNISDNVLAKTDSNIENIAKAIFEKFEIASKNAIPLSAGSQPESQAAKSVIQKLTQAMETMPTDVRRAIALATLGSAGAEPKAIAEFLIQKGFNLNIKQDSVSTQEAMPPILRQVISMLPIEARNNLSSAVLGKISSDIEAIVKAIAEKIDANLKSDVGAKLEINTKNDANLKTGNNIKPDANAQTEINVKPDANARTETGVKPDANLKAENNIKPDANTRTEMSAKADANLKAENSVRPDASPRPDIGASSNTNVKIDAAIKSAVSATPEKLSDGSDAKSGLQKLLQTLESLPAPVRRAIAFAVIGSAEAEPRAIADFLIQKGVNPNIKQDSITNQETQSSALRQILTALPAEARANISNAVLGRAETDIEAIVKGIVEKTDINTNNAAARPSEKPDTQRFIQVMENMPVPIRRAIASATLGVAEAEPRAIAELLIQKGMAANIKQDFISKLETLPPTLRQVINLFSNLPPDTPAEQTAKAILSGDKGIFEAAKGLMSLNESGAAIAPGSKINKPSGEKGPEDSVNLSDRLNYLLRFETLNTQASFSPSDKNSISSWFRSIVDQLILAKSPKPETPEAASWPRQAADLYKPAPNANASRTANSALAQALRQDGTVFGEKAQTWQTWLKGSMKALADPAVSSKEAVFHTLAAKDGVNYFELPLPWMPGRPLEMWIEADKEGGRKDREKTINRVLMALNFSVLGETRVGLESVAKRLNIRIWAEHPRSIEKELPQMQDELSALGFDVQVSLNTLANAQGEAIPSIKSIINGPSLHALG